MAHSYGKGMKKMSYGKGGSKSGGGKGNIVLSPGDKPKPAPCGPHTPKK